MTRQSLRDRTYAMPLFALMFNVGWEVIFSFYVAESVPEKTTFTVWMLLDLGLVYVTVKYGKNEWTHAPVVVRNIGKILLVGVLWWCWALWALSSWWLDLDNPVNPKPGKIYKGVNGVDSTELGFWTALVAQVVLSVSLLVQIIVREHSGGTSYAIWATRFLGSVFGLNVYYGYCWYVWPEAHGYFMNPFAVCLCVTWMVADIVYVVVLKKVKKTEVVLRDGRKVRKGISVQDVKVL